MKPALRSRSNPDGPGPVQGRLLEWLNRRMDLSGLVRDALGEPIPGRSRWAYVFGSGLLFLFVSQVITGIVLTFYYVPSADHAHTTVAYITKAVAGGEVLRSVHYFGAGAMIIVLLLHVTQTVLYGSYKGRRELLWLAGCVLFLLVIVMGFTGYLLPWDQKAYWATTVGTNIIAEVPLVGPGLQALLRGGAGMGTLTISRFFVLHILILPALIFWFIAGHVYFFRKAGAAGPIQADPFVAALPSEKFFPGQVVKDIIFTVLLIAGLAVMAFRYPVELGPPANPADTTFLPRPEWYYLPIFEWLKVWSGRKEVWGILIIPGVLAILFAGLPFMDRDRERRPWKRPFAVGGYLLVLASLFFLGWLSHHQDLSDPAIARQLAIQEAQTHADMHRPFVPEVSGGVSAGTAEAGSAPLVARGQQVYAAYSCNACHGEAGAGTALAPALSGIGEKMNPQQLTAFLQHLPPRVVARGMPTVPAKADEIRDLVAYLESLH